MRVEREERDRGVRGKVIEMGNEDGQQNARLHNQGGITERKVKEKSRDKSIKVQRKVGKGEGNKIARRCEEEIRKKQRKEK